MSDNTSIPSGTLVRHEPSGDIGRIGVRGTSGRVWLLDEKNFGQFVYESECVPLTGAELAATELAWACELLRPELPDAPAEHKRELPTAAALRAALRKK
jgi:hypothetical protein